MEKRKRTPIIQMKSGIIVGINMTEKLTIAKIKKMLAEHANCHMDEDCDLSPKYGEFIGFILDKVEELELKYEAARNIALGYRDQLGGAPIPLASAHELITNEEIQEEYRRLKERKK